MDHCCRDRSCDEQAAPRDAVRLRRTTGIASAALVALVATGMLGACGSTGANRYETRPPGESNVSYEQVLFDPALHSGVRVRGLKAVDEGGQLFVQADIENLSGAAQRFRYKWQWLDARGIELDAISQAWTYRAIEPGDVMSVQGVSSSPRATDFRLLMMRAQ